MTEQIFKDLHSTRSYIMWPVERGSGPAVVQRTLGAVRVIFSEQVHGTQITIVNGLRHDTVLGADGLVTTQPDIALAVGGADCQILFAIDPTGPVIGVVHSGWKGTLASISSTFVSRMIEQGAHLDRLRVHIGPSIGPCHYNVDLPDTEPRFQWFLDRFGSMVAYISGGDKIIDLRAAQRQMLLEAGITEPNLTIDTRCTFCSTDGFPSHRREGEARHENLIGCTMIKSNTKVDSP